MKPTIGRIVVIHQPSGEQIAAIVTEVIDGANLIKASGFIPNGNVSGFDRLQKRELAAEGATFWDWPEREDMIAAAAPLEPYGAFNVLGLLGGDFGAIVGPLLVMLYQANKGRIEAGSDRIMTPPESAINYVLDRLGIKDESARAEIREAARVWGDKGGDLLVKIADAKAGGN